MRVRRSDIAITMRGGVAEGFVFRPDGEGPWPGVLFLTDIGGIRDANIGMAERLAGEGFVVLMPNVFYRWGKPPVFDFSWKMGSPEMMKRFGELATPLTPDAVEKDQSTYLDFLAAQQGVAPGPFGVVGYCFTGAHALRAAAARPDKIAAAASFHGGGLYTDQPTSPHRVLSRVQARLYFGHAVKDQSMNEQAIAALEDALKAWGGAYENETYEGALHGWTVPGRAEIYNHEQAERAFEKLAALFKATLT